jgi:hypothetical protein
VPVLVFGLATGDRTALTGGCNPALLLLAAADRDSWLLVVTASERTTTIPRGRLAELETIPPLVVRFAVHRPKHLPWTGPRRLMPWRCGTSPTSSRAKLPLLGHRGRNLYGSTRVMPAGDRKRQYGHATVNRRSERQLDFRWNWWFQMELVEIDGQSRSKNRGFTGVTGAMEPRALASQSRSQMLGTTAKPVMIAPHPRNSKRNRNEGLI